MLNPLDGLNVVYPHQPAFDNNDLVSGGPSQSDLSLEIWDRLPFNLEDGNESVLSEEKSDSKKRDRASQEEAEEGQNAETAAGFTGFEGINWAQTLPQPQVQFPASLPGNADALQLLLSNLLQQQQAAQYPNLSLAQLLAQQQSMGMSPNIALNATPPPAPAPSVSTTRPADDVTAPPPAKRARSRKASVSSPDTASDSVASPESNFTSTPLSASEDKRRRNTAASARFRQKKKEREVALEAKAKELQDQVTGLEKECETLRRENNWLKGLVVGVTGAGAAAQNTQATN